MSDLRERFQELADVAALHSRPPGPEVVRRRVRHRRLRLVGGTAALVVLAMVAGTAGIGRLSDRPPRAQAPAAGPTTTVPGRWIPSAVPLPVEAQPGPYPGPDPGGIVRDVTSLVRGCQGTSRVRLWARTQGQVWLIAAKPPRPGQSRVCWASALMHAGGGGALGTHAPSASPLQVTYAGGGGDRRVGVVSGTVTKRAVRLRVLFRKGPPLEVTPVEAGDEFPVNFWAGLFLETGSPPPGGQMPELAVDRILAFDQAGKQVAACRARLGPGNTCQL
jgi:hypothetical protein